MASPLAQSLAIDQIARAEREGRAHLVETKPAREWWVNEYTHGLSRVYDSREQADANALPNRVRLLHLVGGAQ